MTTQPSSNFELKQDGNLWVAVHTNTGIASQGSTPSEAVVMAQDAVHLHNQDHTPGDDDYQRIMLTKSGISLEDVTGEIDTPDGMP